MAITIKNLEQSPNKIPSTSMSASDLLQNILSEFRLTQYPFVILRNYEKLPHDWNNDIDILVKPEHIIIFNNIVQKAMIASVTSADMQSMHRLNFRANRVQCTDRELHIDLYSAMSKAWVTYASTDLILEKRIYFHPLFDVPEATHEKLLIAAKELFSYGIIRERYHAKVGGINNDIAGIYSRELFRNYLTKKGAALIVKTLGRPSIQARPSLKTLRVLDLVTALRWGYLRRQTWIDVHKVEPGQ